jgi:hypothetical protein
MDDHNHSVGSSRLPRRLWLGSGLLSLACLIALSSLWGRAYTASPAPHPADTVVTTPAEVTRYLAAHVPAPKNSSAPPVFIPTGVYIQSIEFKGPYNVRVAGYLWQRYANDLPHDLDKGVFLPGAELQRFTQLYRGQQGNEELIGWSFEAMLRQQFDYRRYPLDRQQIRLRLWHIDFERNVYLAPDLGAYTLLAPAELPGLYPALELENWDLQQSFFSYRANQYNANFGIQGYVADQPQPELCFSILTKRYLVSALISWLLAPLVILLQLFVLVMVIGPDARRLELFGVRPGGIIFTGAAFFFAVLVAQTALRNEVKAAGVVYLESMHLLTYAVILAVATNSVLLVARANLGLFHAYDNLWVEVSFWPAILLAMVVITFVTLRL